MDERSKKHSKGNRISVNKHNRKYKNDNPDKIREYHLLYNYGITLEEYENILIDQNGLCAICNNPEKFIAPKTGQLQKLTVDHCHTTGKIRGLLCRTCNSALGKLKDNIEILNKAIDYLRKSENEKIK